MSAVVKIHSPIELYLLEIVMEKKMSVLTITLVIIVSLYALSIYLSMDFNYIRKYFNIRENDTILNRPSQKNIPVSNRPSQVKKNVPVSNLPSHEYLIVKTPKRNSSIGLPVITKWPGGLGNQLFEFACAYSIARKRNSNVYVVAPPQDVYSKDHKHTQSGRAFALNHFKINFSTDGFQNFGSSKIFDFNEQNIWEKTLPEDRILRVNDVCVSEVYFKEYRQEIKDMFVLDIDEKPVKNMLEKIANSESVSVHVRRGDYTEPTQNRTIPITFQKRAMKWMERMVPNATFFVFSDDLEYTKKEFEGYRNLFFVDNSSEKLASLYDFLIMSRCKHNIIANSTFSWWAAYLNANKNKIIIGPMPRHPPGWNDKMYTNKNFHKYRELVLDYYLYPPDWLTLNPFEY